jgi:hypothetical protein
MRGDSVEIDPQTEVQQASQALAAHRIAMAEHQRVVGGFNARIARANAQDDLKLALARREDFRQRRAEVVGHAFVDDVAVDEAPLDHQEHALDKAIEQARRAAEREAAGVAVLTKMRDEAAREADIEAKRARALEYRLEVAQANLELQALVGEFSAVARRLARVRVRCMRINKVADPEHGLPRVGVPNMGEVAQLDLPNPPPPGAPSPSAFQIPMERLVVRAEREIAG